MIATKGIEMSDVEGAVTAPPRLKLRIRRAQYGARTVLSDYPSVYLRFARRAHPAGPGKVLASDTEIMIDGFTRSASTFAVVAFQLAQPAPVRVARHLHAAAHLIAAARLEVPCLVCVRPPESTVLSAVIRETHVSITQALWSYARFYEKIRPYASCFVIARFEDITTDFGAVIERVNSRFGKSFGVFEHTEANVQRCFDLIEHRSRRPAWVKVLADYQSGLVTTEELYATIDANKRGAPAPALHEQFVARPSESRNAMKAALRDRYHDPATTRLRERAQRAYERFVEVGDRAA